MTGRFRLACALLGIAAAGCQQTWVLDESALDAGQSGTGGTSGNHPTDASADARCLGVPQLISFTPDTPQVVVALDRSTAMNAAFGNTDQLHAALSAIQADVSKYSGGRNGRSVIQFAFLDFPDTASDCDASTGCCPSDVTASYSDFQNASTCTASGPTLCIESTTRPTAAALNWAYNYYFDGTTQHNNERYVLLVTDGDPPQGTCSNNACMDAIQAVDDLGGIGVTTEVVALGVDPQDVPCLSELANAQSVFPSPFVISTAGSLPGDIDSIAGTVAQNACRLTLAAPPASGHLTVLFDQMPQPQETGTTGNGWNYDGNTRVFLHQDLCQSFLQSGANPNSTFGLQICDGCCPDHLGQTPP